MHGTVVLGKRNSHFMSFVKKLNVNEPIQVKIHMFFFNCDLDSMLALELKFLVTLVQSKWP